LLGNDRAANDLNNAYSPSPVTVRARDEFGRPCVIERGTGRIIRIITKPAAPVYGA
jgi:hypothetical protein